MHVRPLLVPSALRIVVLVALVGGSSSARAGAKPLADNTASPPPSTCQVTAISTGLGHSCAVAGGSAKCWGGNLSAQVGRGDISSRAPVSDLVLPSGPTAIGAGMVNSCVVIGTGEVHCWGAGMMFGSDVDVKVPTKVNGLTGVKSVSVGTMSACALLGSGGVKCWGAFGAAPSRTPADVRGLVTHVTAMAFDAKQLCAVVKGAAKCGSTDGVTPVPGLESGVSSIAAGRLHACAVVNGGAKCWGSNQHGQLGNGTTVESQIPVSVTGLKSGVRAVYAGGGTSCAVMTSGAAKCWGFNLNGVTGSGEDVTAVTTPTDVIGLTEGVASMSVSKDDGGGHACALLTNGTLKCWGRGDQGQTGGEANSLSPVHMELCPSM